MFPFKMLKLVATISNTWGIKFLKIQIIIYYIEKHIRNTLSAISESTPAIILNFLL